MYQAYWGLSLAPFRGTSDPRFFHQGPTQDEALARLHFVVEDRRAVALLQGESGAGKSFLLNVFARQLGNIDRQTALVNLAGLDVHDFLSELAAQLGFAAPASASKFALSRALADHITANRYQRIATILLLDDADTARPAVRDQIERLAQFDTSSESRLSIVLAAQPQGLEHLGTRLLELADLRIDLEGWDLDDTCAFVKKSLATAGRTTPVFSEAALAHLHELTSGIPRRIKQLADMALLAGAGENLIQIEPGTLDSVFRELGVVVADLPDKQISRSARSLAI